MDERRRRGRDRDQRQRLGRGLQRQRRRLHASSRQRANSKGRVHSISLARKDVVDSEVADARQPPRGRAQQPYPNSIEADADGWRIWTVYLSLQLLGSDRRQSRHVCIGAKTGQGQLVKEVRDLNGRPSVAAPEVPLRAAVNKIG